MGARARPCGEKRPGSRSPLRGRPQARNTGTRPMAKAKAKAAAKVQAAPLIPILGKLGLSLAFMFPKGKNKASKVVHKFSEELWEMPRVQTGLKLLGELAPEGLGWNYIVNDENRRSFAAYLKSSF